MTNFFHNFTKKVALFTLLVFFILIIINPKLVVFSVKETVVLFFNNLFAPIFIFYTLTDLLINYDFLKVLKITFFKKLSSFLHVNTNSLFILIFSMITGFPSGSKYICDFYNKKLISYDEATYLLMFTHFSNPLFILGTIGNLFGKSFSIKILISTFLSNIIISIIFRPKNSSYNSNNKIVLTKLSFTECLTNSFKKTYQIIMIVLSNSIVFTTLGYLINRNIHNKVLQLFIFGILDLTKGITLLNNYSFSLLFKGIVICTFISFGSININVQVKSIIEKERLPYIYFLSGRLIATFLSILIYFLLFYCK
ncbi:MAG: hypothetical protein IK997_03130 [Bacilli bacterium]|nr:hypothetical protein [Bacilli bacterium]